MTNDLRLREQPPTFMIVALQSELFAPQPPLRAAITAAYRQDEAQSVGELMTRMHWPSPSRCQAQAHAQLDQRRA